MMVFVTWGLRELKPMLLVACPIVEKSFCPPLKGLRLESPSHSGQCGHGRASH